MSRAAEMARLAAGVLALALGLTAWSAGAEPLIADLKPGLAAVPLPPLKPRAPDEAIAPGLLARIDFAPQELELTPASAARLTDLAQSLKQEPDAPVAIVAHAEAQGAGMTARRIALGRALAVRSFLMERGIQSGRLTVQAFEAAEGGEPAERVDILWPPR
jgi:outer membrane protein OmpA-like peptidoglycan-associated protein